MKNKMDEIIAHYTNQLEHYFNKALAVGGDERHYVQRFIQMHLARIILTTNKLDDKLKSKALAALAASMTKKMMLFKSDLAAIIDSASKEIAKHPEQQEKLEYLTDDAYLRAQLRVKGLLQSRSFLKFVKQLAVNKSDLDKILTVIAGELNQMRLIANSSGGSGHHLATAALKKNLKLSGMQCISFDMIRLLKLYYRSVGKQGVDQWNAAMSNGNHNPSYFPKFNYLLGRATTADLMDFGKVDHSRLIANVKVLLNDIFPVFVCKDSPLISTQPTNLSVIVEVLKGLMPGNDQPLLHICLTDPPTENSFWLHRLMQLNNKQLAEKVVLHFHEGEGINAETILTGFNKIRESFANGNLDLDESNKLIYLRPGITNSSIADADQAVQNFMKSRKCDGQRPLALVSLGSNPGIAYLQSLVKDLVVQHDVIVLCGSNSKLQDDMNEKDYVTGLSFVNGHSVALLSQHAEIIAVAGGGMTVIELASISDIKPTVIIPPLIAGIRPEHEIENLKWLSGHENFRAIESGSVEYNNVLGLMR